MRRLAFAALAALCTAAPAHAQRADDDIIVTAPRLEEMIRAFVGEVTVEQGSEDQVARWDRRICPQVAGLQARQAQFVADRLSQRAHQIGLRPGGPDCRANILIFVTPDADRFTQELTSQFPVVFNPRVPNMAQQNDEALTQFISSDAPVRWWHVAQTVSREGAIVRNTDPRVDAQGGLEGVSIVRTGITSRIARPTRQDFNRVILVVDAARAEGARFDALADYIAMVTLAQLNPDADTSANDTVLNLFTQTNAVAGMTTWDLAYLEGLYSARRNAQNSRQQRADISRRMRTSELDEAYLEVETP